MSAPVKETISFDDFDKLDVRVGQITAVDDVKGSSKLVALTVDFGGFTRQILSGLKETRDDPTELTGMQCLFVVNLAPRKMAGLVSEGMLLDLGYDDGLGDVMACPEHAVPNGTRVS